MDSLGEELERLDRELAQAEADHARLTARVDGLRAERDALARAITSLTSAAKMPWPQQDIASMTKNQAIVAVLERADHPLRIKEIVAALTGAGRENETYNGVSVYLQDLLERKRIVRVERGLYALPGR